MNIIEALALTRPERAALKKSVSKSYVDQVKKDRALHSALKKAPVFDDVRLDVIQFRDVLLAPEDATKWQRASNSKSNIALSPYRMVINGEEVDQSGKNSSKFSLYSVLNFKKGVPITVKLTIGDKEVRKGPPRNYIPIGIAFVPRNKGSKNADIKIAQRDLKEVKAYFFESAMYFTFSPKFNAKDLSKYAVIIQCLESGQVGVIDPHIPTEM